MLVLTEVMKNIIREKRRLSFENKRITPVTIRSFAKIIEGEIKELTKKEAETVFLMYSIDAANDSSYESQSAEIFKEGEIIESKVVRKIFMRFNTIDNSKNIEIQIVHSLKNDKSENFILVSGDEANWVNGVLARFSEILKETESQPKYSKGLGYYMFILWVIFIYYYFRIFYPEIDRISYTWLKLAVLLGIPILSIILSFRLFDYLNNLWPSVELQTGQEHQQIPAKKRRIIYGLIVVVFIPIVLEILSRTIK